MPNVFWHLDFNIDNVVNWRCFIDVNLCIV